MNEAKGSAPMQAQVSAPDQEMEINLQIPSAKIQEELARSMINQFFEYLEFALNNQDSGILRTARFKILLENAKKHLAKTK